MILPTERPRSVYPQKVDCICSPLHHVVGRAQNRCTNSGRCTECTAFSRQRRLSTLKYLSDSNIRLKWVTLSCESGRCELLSKVLTRSCSCGFRSGVFLFISNKPVSVCLILPQTTTQLSFQFNSKHFISPWNVNVLIKQANWTILTTCVCLSYLCCVNVPSSCSCLPSGSGVSV